MRVVPVILSGGSGTRLWPMSRKNLPKQFVELSDGASLFQRTLERMVGLDDAGDPTVVTSIRHIDLVEQQLTASATEGYHIIAEPAARNTAPAIALAALALDEDDLMVVVPSDSAVEDEGGYRAALSVGIEPAQQGRLVAFGVVPSRPETGFGYIEADQGHLPWSQIARFVEKPDRASAERYVESGRFLWNAGMFMFRAGTLLGELTRHQPEVLTQVRAAWDSSRSEGRVTIPGDVFGSAPSISIDHAVMEKTDRGVVVPLDVAWSDVGSWEALWQLEVSTGRDGAGRHDNVIHGSVTAHDVTGSYIRSDGRHVAVVGLNDVVVVDTDDALLIVAKNRSQDVKEILDSLPPELL